MTVAARRADAAREVAQLAGAVGVGVALDRVDDAGWGGADLVANTTPVGMIGGLLHSMRWRRSSCCLPGVG